MKQTARKENFVRPNHPDFMDSSELQKIGYSGMRNNSISDEVEIWIDGRIEQRVTRAQIEINPNAVQKAYNEAFFL